MEGRNVQTGRTRVAWLSENFESCRLSNDLQLHCSYILSLPTYAELLKGDLSEGWWWCELEIEWALYWSLFEGLISAWIIRTTATGVCFVLYRRCWNGASEWGIEKNVKWRSDNVRGEWNQMRVGGSKRNGRLCGGGTATLQLQLTFFGGKIWMVSLQLHYSYILCLRTHAELLGGVLIEIW